MKDIKLKPLQTTLILLVFGLLFVVAFWANGLEVAERGPEVIRLTPSGNLVVAVQDKLYEYAPDESHIATYDLAQLNTPFLTGNLDFFPNGDVLLRLALAEHSLLDDILSFLRLNTLESERPPNNFGEGLHRCNLQRMECRSLAAEDVRDDRAFSVAIDQATSQIYYANTAGHSIHRLSSDGREEAAIREELFFPNRLVLIDDYLYVANTNKHRVDAFPIATTPFGANPERHPVKAPNSGGNRWPFSLQPLGSGWVVNLMQNSMRDGRLAKFDAEWVFTGWFDLPDAADPIDLAWFNNELLVTDYSNNRIHRMKADGSLLGEFRPPDIAQHLQEIDARRDHYRNLTILAVALIGLGLVGGVLFAVTRGKKQPNRSEIPPLDPANMPDLSVPMDWMLPTRLSFFISRGMLGLFLLSVALLPSSLIIIAWERLEKLASFQIWLAPMALCLAMLSMGGLIWLLTRDTGVWAIRIIDGDVELHHRRGRKVRVDANRVLASGRFNALLVGNVMLQLRNAYGKSVTYRTSDVKDELIPRLQALGVQVVNPWQFTLSFWRQSSSLVRRCLALCIVTMPAALIALHYWTEQIPK